ncbi:hypothetical protein DAPPUDRAFT_311701 [Daphnia pulex]|uniref:Uncharacterized protein n=1 Tax=Daphnia pulex TaxID=6669 RepID=E9FXN2_DAPPU|nr:hypothetical protein DAPPUDRAFT_311701 [Daphnia pulex]|eukprot:EFX88122.1 hypothetical protein DAPPUDRAFT_311701 [Daphnia pulex]
MVENASLVCKLQFNLFAAANVTPNLAPTIFIAVVELKVEVEHQDMVEELSFITTEGLRTFNSSTCMRLYLSELMAVPHRSEIQFELWKLQPHAGELAVLVIMIEVSITKDKIIVSLMNILYAFPSEYYLVVCHANAK